MLVWRYLPAPKKKCLSIFISTTKTNTRKVIVHTTPLAPAPETTTHSPRLAPTPETTTHSPRYRMSASKRRGLNGRRRASASSAPPLPHCLLHHLSPRIAASASRRRSWPSSPTPATLVKREEEPRRPSHCPAPPVQSASDGARKSASPTPATLVRREEEPRLVDPGAAASVPLPRTSHHPAPPVQHPSVRIHPTIILTFLCFWFPLIQCDWPPSNPLGTAHLAAAATQHVANDERHDKAQILPVPTHSPQQRTTVSGG